MTHDFIILPSNKDLKGYWKADFSYELRNKEDIFEPFIDSMIGNSGNREYQEWGRLNYKHAHCSKVKSNRGKDQPDLRVLDLSIHRSSNVYLKKYTLLEECSDEDEVDEEVPIRFHASNIGYKYTPLVHVLTHSDRKHKQIKLTSKIFYGFDKKEITEWLYTEVYAQIILTLDEYKTAYDYMDHQSHQHNLSVIKALSNTTTDEDAMKAYKKMVKDNKKKERDEERARQERVEIERRERQQWNIDNDNGYNVV